MYVINYYKVALDIAINEIDIINLLDQDYY